MIQARSLLPGALRRSIRSMVVDCSLRGCRAFHLSHRLLRGEPGIFLQAKWYCSPACLRDALDLQLGARSPLIAATVRGTRMPFRLILLARGVISEEQLEQAGRRAAAGEELGDVLVDEGFASGAEVAAVRAEQAGCAFYAGQGLPIPPEYRLPAALTERYHVVPMHYAPANGRLLLGFLYKVDPELLRMTSQLTRSTVEPCFVTQTAYKQQLVALQGWDQFKSVRSVAPTWSRAISTLMQHAIGSGADQMCMSRSRAMVWARFTQGSREGRVRGGLDVTLDVAEMEHEDSYAKERTASGRAS